MNNKPPQTLTEMTGEDNTDETTFLQGKHFRNDMFGSYKSY